MTSLSWRSADKGDRVRLQQFSCTVPEQRLPGSNRVNHPRPWERDVEKWFRADAIPEANIDTNAGCDGRLLLGFKGSDLAACVSHGRLRNPGIETPLRAALEFDGPIRVLKALAVACAFRGQGGAVAEEAMEHALQDMLHRDEEQICVVVGRIHRENRASQNLAERMGFELLDDLTEVDNLQAWFIVIEADDDLEAE